MTAVIVDALGVRPVDSVVAMRERVAADKFFWLDVCGGVAAAPTDILNELGLKQSDIAWALRFGQTGRMSIGGQTLRAATWIAEPTGALLEVHLLCTQRCILTLWNGDAATLGGIREQFAERAGGLEGSPYHAAGIVLQLLLGTVDHAIRDIDLGLDDLRSRLQSDAGSADFNSLAGRARKLQSFLASFSRFSSSVRTAIVGVETVSGMDTRGAEELNEYAEQVEDVEEQLAERRRWMTDMMHDYTTAIAQRQGEQISRLTLVSLIFLPITALTGFFGMNFNWMIDAIGGAAAFFILGVVLPLLCVVLTVIWLMRRGLLESKWNPFPPPKSATSLAGPDLSPPVNPLQP